MGPIPSDLAEWLPIDVGADEIAAFARIRRTFDRVHGEALLVRLRSGELALLTRPDPTEHFRALPLAAEGAIEIVQGRELRLRARMLDGRLLTMPLTTLELDGIRAALGLDVGRTSSAPPRAVSDRPPSLRPPESAASEVVRLPRSVRSPSDRPRSVRTPSELPRSRAPSSPPPARRSSRPPPPARSLRPPVFEGEPLPVVEGARDLASLHARFGYHWDRGELDEAIQVARALAHLGAADPVERGLARQHADDPPLLAIGAGAALDRHLVHAHVAHEDEHPGLGRLLAAITPAWIAMRARPEGELGLRPGDEIDPRRLDPRQPPVHPFVDRFVACARALGMDAPRLFLRVDVPGGITHLVTRPPASLCGATLANGFDDRSQMHVVGHHLALYRPEAHLVALVPAPADLHALVLAVLWLEGKLAPEQARLVDARIGALAEAIARHMPEPVRAAVRRASVDLAIHGDAPSALGEPLRRHRRAVLLGAARTGLVLSGSLAVSDRMQRIMPAVQGLTHEEVRDDLVAWSVSPANVALRRELGIAQASEAGA